MLWKLLDKPYIGRAFPPCACARVSWGHWSSRSPLGSMNIYGAFVRYGSTHVAGGLWAGQIPGNKPRRYRVFLRYGFGYVSWDELPRQTLSDTFHIYEVFLLVMIHVVSTGHFTFIIVSMNFTWLCHVIHLLPLWMSTWRWKFQEREKDLLQYWQV